jgi:hypothetical protein
MYIWRATQKERERAPGEIQISVRWKTICRSMAASSLLLLPSSILILPSPHYAFIPGRKISALFGNVSILKLVFCN